MPLRTTVSRVAARGVAVEPAVTAEEIEQHVPPETAEAIQTLEDAFQQEEEAAAAPPAPKKRRGRGPAKPRPKVSLGPLPVAGETDSAPQLRSKIRDVEATIKETRARHEAEMKVLKTAYADLHTQLFNYVK